MFNQGMFLARGESYMPATTSSVALGINATRMVISGDGATLAAHDTGINGSGGGGTLKVFALVSGVWTLQHTYAPTVDSLGPIAAAPWMEHTLSISYDGNTIACSAQAPLEPSYEPGRGAVYVFTRSGTTWSSPKVLVATSPSNGDGFGSFLALDDAGTTLVLGTSRSSMPYSSMLEVWNYSGSWSRTYFDQSYGFSNRVTGVAVSADGLTLTLAFRTGTNSAVWSYVKSGTWSFQSSITAPYASVTTNLGRMNLSSDGNLLSFTSSNWSASGSDDTVVYSRSAGTWSLQQAIAIPGSIYARQCDMNAAGNVMIINTDAGSGAVTSAIWSRSGVTWSASGVSFATNYPVTISSIGSQFATMQTASTAQVVTTAAYTV